MSADQSRVPHVWWNHKIPAHALVGGYHAYELDLKFTEGEVGRLLCSERIVRGYGFECWDDRPYPPESPNVCPVCLERSGVAAKLLRATA